MKKILYIIPGFGESTKGIAYQKIKKSAEKKGYDVRIVSIQWAYNTFSSWVEGARNTIEKWGSKEATILGFSFGAMIAIELSRIYRFNKIISCSLSPYYSNDLVRIPNIAKDFLGKRRIEDFKKYSFPTDVQTKNLFIFGVDDWDYALKKIKERSGRWHGPKKLLLLKDVGHDIGHESYIKAIVENL